MRLVPCKQSRVSVPCVGTNHAALNAVRGFPAATSMFPIGDGFADLDGPAFQAYYCAKCAAEITREVA